MTRDKAIAELIRIWHSPHLDLSLKAGLGEAIEALKGADGDLISRQEALDILDDFEADIELGKRDSYKAHREKLLSIHSAYHPLCALADRECPFQGKEYAWCLTCPHISEEDRALVKKVASEPKTGEWIPVSERLPDERQDVYVTVLWDDYGDYITAYGMRTRIGWHLHSNAEGELIKGYTVIAWMPLPEPYREDGDGGEE